MSKTLLNMESCLTIVKNTFLKRFLPFLCVVVISLSYNIVNGQTSPFTNATPGSHTFTVPFGVTQITVEVWGAGGAGGTIDGNGSANKRGAGGGGGGAYAKKVITVTPCASISYTVGAGGTRGVASGDSFFVNAITVMAKGGLNASEDNPDGASGGIATSSIGDIRYSGGNGANGTTSGTEYGGGGGSSAGSGSNGNSSSNSTGGIAPTGGAAGGNGKTGSEGSGFIGNPPGGGGGGALKSSNNVVQLGGIGGNGQIKLSWVVSASNPPTANNGTNAACNSFSVNWTAVSYATGYRLDVSTVNDFATFVTGYNDLNVGNVTTRGVTGLNAGTTYYYRVRAVNSCGTSASSTIITYATLAAPTVPGIINGAISQCPSLIEQSYSISSVPNATTYSWTVPAGWTITSGAGTINITVTIGAVGGNITVAAGNACGTSASSSLVVSVSPCSIDFDGVNDYLSRPSIINGLNNITIMAWVKSDSNNSSNKAIAGEDSGCLLWMQNGKKPMFTIKSTGNAEQSVSCADINLNEWHHIAGTYSSATGVMKLYVDGEMVGSTSVGSTGAVIQNTSSALGTFEIGRLSSNVPNKQYFKGAIDEVRVFDSALTDSQLQQIVYQEIENNGGNVRGLIIPRDVADSDTKAVLSWSNLKLYYRMGTDFTADGKVKDYSGNGNHASMFNMTTQQQETAPMPFVTKNDGDWDAVSIWANGDVWDVKDKTKIKNYSIIKISSDITINNSLITTALIIDANKTLTVNGDNEIRNSWYLELNGTIDLKSDSQLVQTSTSDLVTSATGKLLRRQEGTSNVFRYNYWSSPVGIKGATSLIDNNAVTNNPNNSAFKLNMLKDPSGFDMSFTSAYNQVGKISTYWLYTFKNGVTYWDWTLLSPTEGFTPGIGYTQKGTGNAGLQQQYIFEGKPNNGTILVNVTDKGGAGSVANVSKTEYLLGNPYPSALDVNKFIDDNVGVIGGTLQLWQQWAGDSHYLDEYKGGYAQVNKLGAVRASQFVGIYGATTGASEGTMPPSKYLPVGQGFIAEVVASGTVKFKNSQRVFIKEADADGTYNSGSTFFKSSNTKSKSTSTSEELQTNVMKKIRLEFNSVVGPQTKRELLLGFSDMTTDGYDYGYDAECSDENNNDFNLSLNGKNMNMQAYSVITTDKVIPLNFKSSASNTFEIQATDLENIGTNQDVYLRDNLTGTYFDLKQNTSYRFTSVAGKFNSRFEVVFQSKQQSLGIEEALATENHIFYQNSTNTLYAKKLNTAIAKLAIVNMRGQTIMEFNNVSQETLSNGIKISNVSKGAYVAWFKTETGQVITKKIIVN